MRLVCASRRPSGDYLCIDWKVARTRLRFERFGPKSVEDDGQSPDRALTRTGFPIVDLFNRQRAGGFKVEDELCEARQALLNGFGVNSQHRQCNETIQTRLYGFGLFRFRFSTCGTYGVMS